MMFKRRAICAVIAAVLVFFFIAPAAIAVHDDGLFELDGNASASAAPGDDWSQVHAGTSSALATSFINDGTNPTDTTYLHTGGSKDIEDFSSWVPTSTDEAPDKDEIMHAYAAAYMSAEKHLVLYFGLDRFDASGDSQVGFWFAKDGVTDDGTTVSGHHQVGDILILSDFVNGGAVPVVRVFKWVGSGGSDGAIDEITPSGSADCASVGAGDDRCAIVNQDTENAPWSFTDKSGSNDFHAGEFYEGGVDLTALGITDNCFSTFIAETRTSQATDARLKDVAMGSFPLCKIDVSKTGSALSKVGDPVHYTITITNSGSATLYKQSIVDDILGNLTDGSNSHITSDDCGSSLAPGDHCTIHLTYTVKAGDPDPLVNHVDVTYNNKSNLSGTEVSDSDSHSTNLFQPSITVAKTGEETAKVGDTVHYHFTITNTSSADSPDLIMNSIDDSLIGDLAGDAPAACDQLAPGASCSFEVDRVVQADDPDPLPNTVTVHYHPDGFPNDIHATDQHIVDLFAPGITVQKTGDSIGKIGDPAHYHFVITNTSSADTPDLVMDSVVDSLIGDLGAAATDAGCATLASGASCSFDAERVVQAGDPDPLPNTVTVHYHPTGFDTDVTAHADHSVNLFQPSVTIDKSGDTLSMVGNDVTYHFVVTNTSSSDSPDLFLNTISDTVLGDLSTPALNAGCGQLASGASCQFDVTRTIQATDTDPLPNTVTVHYHPEGFPNDIHASDDHSVNLFQPSVVVDKNGDLLGKVGDNVHYTFTITNTSSSDTPDLQMDTVDDTLLGSLNVVAINADCASLAPGASCQFTADRVVQAGDPDPLPNTVTVHYHPDGFTNDVTSSDDHAVNLFQPSVAVTKSGPATATVGKPITYTFTVTNTSSADSPPLNIESMTDVGDGWTGLGDLTAMATQAGCGTLAPGASCSFQVTITAPAGPDPLANTVSVLYHPEGFPNNITASAHHSLRLIAVLPEKLTRTGTDTIIFLSVSFTLLLAGLGLRAVARRRTSEQ